ncbi:hypothetical protein [Leptolyngbya sp. BC1307]|uniref:hypothetical protein n=1 Tax=Leptolyngbya sp. BC1307 TaxID=2029589 RepID=UPI000EFAAA70|nr:hypothetical protein [Leptolyngbya sp. BC1307]
MKTMTCLIGQPLAAGPVSPALESVMALPEAVPVGSGGRRSLRHILLGHPEDIRQTIHLLHTLHYAETVLWTPIMTIEEPLTIPPAQGEAISLLQKLV